MARNEQLIRQHKILQILERYRFGRLLEENDHLSLYFFPFTTRCQGTVRSSSA